MSPDLALGIVSALTAVMLAIIGWLTYRETHRDKVESADVAKIKAMIQAELQPLSQQVRDLKSQSDSVAARQIQQQQETRELSEKQGRILDRLAVIETKIEVFWKAVAMDAAKIIHSPDPRRAVVDNLIEEFQRAADGHGVMPTEDYNKLREILLSMRDWEPGMNSDFPIYPGEQFAAAVLLRTMDHALEASKRGRRNAN